MKLGILAGYSGRKFNIAMDAIKHAENLGYDSLWTAEAYGSDAVTPAAWILAQTQRLKVGTAIMQMPARSPAMAAMTAMVCLGQGAHGCRHRRRPLTTAARLCKVLHLLFLLTLDILCTYFFGGWRSKNRRKKLFTLIAVKALNKKVITTEHYKVVAVIILTQR